MSTFSIFTYETDRESSQTDERLISVNGVFHEIIANSILAPLLSHGFLFTASSTILSSLLHKSSTSSSVNPSFRIASRSCSVKITLARSCISGSIAITCHLSIFSIGKYGLRHSNRYILGYSCPPVRWLYLYSVGTSLDSLYTMKSPGLGVNPSSGHSWLVLMSHQANGVYVMLYTNSLEALLTSHLSDRFVHQSSQCRFAWRRHLVLRPRRIYVWGFHSLRDTMSSCYKPVLR
jgi:hypothetical protein